MSTLELQNTLIRKILETKDVQLLKQLYGMLFTKRTEVAFSVSQVEKELITRSLLDLKDGKIHTNDEVFEETERWLNE